MTGLQQAFYIVGLVYMAVSLLLILGVVIALGVIRKKVVSLENIVKEKLELVTSLRSGAGNIVDTIKNLTKHKPE